MTLHGGEWAKWTSWISRIKEDLFQTVSDRTVFREFSDVVRANEEWINANHGLYFCDFVARSYVARAATGVRRMVKPHRDAISLAAILTHMKECAADLTYEFYVTRLPRQSHDFMEWQRGTFRQLSEDGRVVSANIVGADLAELDRLTDRVEAFADRRVAHLDRKGGATRITFDELDSAIDAVNAIACKYILFLTGHAYDSLEFVVQFPWQMIFDVPLKPKR